MTFACLNIYLRLHRDFMQRLTLSEAQFYEAVYRLLPRSLMK
jgi:hypothetical protein